jgi:hypothetical protein
MIFFPKSRVPDMDSAGIATSVVGTLSAAFIAVFLYPFVLVAQTSSTLAAAQALPSQSPPLQPSQHFEKGRDRTPQRAEVLRFKIAQLQNERTAPDVESRTREACGVLLPASPAPGAKALILVSVKRRAPIDRELQQDGAFAAEVDATDADLCFESMGADRVLVRPFGRKEKISPVTIAEDEMVDRWLRATATHSGRVRLLPSSDCADILKELTNRGVTAPSIWVEEGRGLSRCEKDAGGAAHIDMTKTIGYDGVIILKSFEAW